MWVMAAPDPNLVVDITDRFGLKIDALRAHDSQTAHMDDLEDRITQWSTMAAQQAELPEGRLAEMFKVVAVP